MKLFIELYLDEDVSVLLAKLLRARGFEVITTRDAKMLGASDKEQLEYAIRKEKVLLTHNRLHFEKFHKEYLRENKEHYGIIIASRHNEYITLKRLLKILDSISADEMKNQLRYI
jgi:predicted nuclease of predicted toxin-antitoxin system